jgi:hypothetical protein
MIMTIENYRETLNKKNNSKKLHSLWTAN